VVEKLKAEHEVQIEWRPFYLRPDTSPEGSELPPYIRERMASSQERLKQMALGWGMEMVFPTRIPNTRLAHEATEYARAHHKLLEFHKIVFRLYYGEGKDISHWHVLRVAAQEAGLDPDDMQKAVESGTYTPLVAEQIKLAKELEISGVPTYILNDKYAIVGAQPYEAFQRVLVRLESEE
jgi:predicted DsbA family dithiol-disulfide isomerase